MHRVLLEIGLLVPDAENVHLCDVVALYDAAVSCYMGKREGYRRGCKWVGFLV